MKELDALGHSLARINLSLSQIQDRITNGPRDKWSKLGAIAPIIAGIIVGVFGLYVTAVYDFRQKEAEIAVARVRILATFLPHLYSGDERRKEAAILGIASLGNQELAEKVASIFPSAGSAKALSTFARSEDTATADRSRKALASLGSSRDESTAVAARIELSSLLSDLDMDKNVVKIHSGKTVGTGFFVGGGDMVVTVAHLFNPSTVSDKIVVTSRDGVSSACTLVKLDKDADVAILRLATKSSVQGIKTIAMPEIGMPVVILGSTRSGWKSTSGRITDTDVQIGLFVGRQISADLDSEPGFSGAPVFNFDGQLIGMLHASSSTGNSILVPASRIVRVVDSIDDGSNNRLRAVSAGG